MLPFESHYCKCLDHFVPSLLKLPLPPFFTRLMTSLHQDTWMNQKRIFTALTIYLYPRPYALSFLMLLWMKCHIPWKGQSFHPFSASHSLNSRMLQQQFSPSLLHHCSPSLSLYIIPISIQSCCYCSHLRKPPFLSSYTLTSLSLSCKTLWISCLYQPSPISLPNSLFDPP